MPVKLTEILTEDILSDNDAQSQATTSHNHNITPNVATENKVRVLGEYPADQIIANISPKHFDKRKNEPKIFIDITKK